MSTVLGVHELPEVLVEGDEDPSIIGSPAQQLAIAWILAHLASLNHIVTGASKPGRQRAARAAVDQEPHPEDARTASSESSAITARS